MKAPTVKATGKITGRFSGFGNKKREPFVLKLLLCHHL